MLKKPRGRPMQYPDKTMSRMPYGFLKRINDALQPDEAQADFVRTAITRELRRRSGWIKLTENR